jgi:hypothetical protein
VLRAEAERLEKASKKDAREKQNTEERVVHEKKEKERALRGVEFWKARVAKLEEEKEEGWMFQKRENKAGSGFAAGIIKDKANAKENRKRSPRR